MKKLELLKDIDNLAKKQVLKLQVINPYMEGKNKLKKHRDKFNVIIFAIRRTSNQLTYH